MVADGLTSFNFCRLLNTTDEVSDTVIPLNTPTTVLCAFGSKDNAPVGHVFSDERNIGLVSNIILVPVLKVTFFLFAQFNYHGANRQFVTVTFEGDVIANDTDVVIPIKAVKKSLFKCLVVESPWR